MVKLIYETFPKSVLEVGSSLLDLTWTLYGNVSFYENSELSSQWSSYLLH